MINAALGCQPAFKSGLVCQAQTRLDATIQFALIYLPTTL